MKSIFYIILIAASIGVFIVIIKPRYDELQATQTQVSSYNSNLDTAAKLKQSREELIAQYNSIPKEDLDNLRALLPDNVDNIRLIIQLDSLATRNGLSKLRNVDYQVVDNKTDASAQQSPESVRKPYGEFVITFQTVGQYSNFLLFLADLERNLRLVDITSVDFSAQNDSQTDGKAPSLSNTYKVTLKTYWLKQ